MKGVFSAFRRQKLSKGKFGSYGAYAFGELLLIVLGILIALAIDNWNQDRQNRHLEHYYLTGLKEEFQQNKIRLGSLIEVNRASYQSAGDLADYLVSPQESWDEHQLSQQLFHALAYEINYNPTQSMLQEVINTGGLNQITDQTLRKHLAGWEPFVQQVRWQEDALREERQHVLNLFRGDSGSIRTILEDNDLATQEMGLVANPDPATNQQIIRSRSFENRMLMYLLTAQRTESELYRPLMQEIDIILELIKRELN